MKRNIQSGTRTRLYLAGLLAILPQALPAQSSSCGSYTRSNNFDHAVASTPGGQINVFFGTSSNSMGRLYGDPRSPNTLSFEDWGGQLGSEPSATSWGPGHIAVFVRGTNAELWYLQNDNGASSGWQSLGGIVEWNPYVVSEEPGNLIAFYRGRDTQTWYREFKNGVWTSHISLGGIATSSPIAVSWGPGHVAVFARGQARDLYYRQRTGGTWTAWTGLGGSIGIGTTVPDPVVVSRGAGLMDVFANQNGRIYQISYNGGSWSAWRALPPMPAGVAQSEPGAAATSGGALVVFARGGPISTHPLLAQPMYKTTSLDGGVTWTAWEQVIGSSTSPNNGAGNPEAAANAYGGVTLSATMNEDRLPARQWVCTYN